MAIKTFNSGVLDDDADMLLNCINPIYPFLLPNGQFLRKFVKNTDYANADDIVITFKGSDVIYQFLATGTDGTVKTGVEADIGGGEVGKKLTFSNVTTDSLHVWAIINV